jgi:hypothetical protein
MRAEAPVPSIRGSYITPSKAWIIRTYGPNVYDRAVDALPARERLLFATELVSTSWYPLSQWTQVLGSVRAFAWETNREDEAAFDRRHLHESISTTMRTIYRVAFGLFSPETIIAKIMPLFKRVYSHGDFDVLQNKPGHCVLRFRDAPQDMLAEIRRSFPIATSWMLETAGQTVVQQKLTPRIQDDGVFSCDLEIYYRRAQAQTQDKAKPPRVSR